MASGGRAGNCAGPGNGAKHVWQNERDFVAETAQASDRTGLEGISDLAFADAIVSRCREATVATELARFETNLSQRGKILRMAGTVSSAGTGEHAGTNCAQWCE